MQAPGSAPIRPDGLVAITPAELERALECERQAAQRRSVALLAVKRAFVLHGRGAAHCDSLQRVYAASAEWRKAQSEVRRLRQQLEEGIAVSV